jgi:hypothetical protein
MGFFCRASSAATSGAETPRDEPTVTHQPASARTAHGVERERIIDLNPPEFEFVVEGGQYTVRVDVDRRASRRIAIVAATPWRISRETVR